MPASESARPDTICRSFSAHQSARTSSPSRTRCRPGLSSRRPVERGADLSLRERVLEGLRLEDALVHVAECGVEVKVDRLLLPLLAPVHLRHDEEVRHGDRVAHAVLAWLRGEMDQRGCKRERDGCACKYGKDIEVLVRMGGIEVLVNMGKIWRCSFVSLEPLNQRSKSCTHTHGQGLKDETGPALAPPIKTLAGDSLPQGTRSVHCTGRRLTAAGDPDGTVSSISLMPLKPRWSQCIRHAKSCDSVAPISSLR